MKIKQFDTSNLFLTATVLQLNCLSPFFNKSLYAKCQPPPLTTAQSSNLPLLLSSVFSTIQCHYLNTKPTILFLRITPKDTFVYFSYHFTKTEMSPDSWHQGFFLFRILSSLKFLRKFCANGTNLGKMTVVHIFNTHTHTYIYPEIQKKKRKKLIPCSEQKYTGKKTKQELTGGVETPGHH